MELIVEAINIFIMVYSAKFLLTPIKVLSTISEANYAPLHEKISVLES